MKKRNIPKISAVILGVLICVFIGVLINKLKENYDPEVFSEDYISIDEVKQELAFTVYSKDEWDDWFSGRKQEYLTQSVLDELLKKLGVSEQIDFVVKRKNRCFMLNSFVTPCQVSPKGARSGYVRQITSKALYLSSLDHLYKLTWCIFRVELFYLWSNLRSKTVHFRSRRSLYRS